MKEGISLDFFNKFVARAWMGFIESSPTKQAFKEWERLHLSILMSVFKSYKKTSTAAQKARAVSLLDAEHKDDLLTKFSASLSIELLNSEDEVEKFALFIVGEVLVGGTDHSMASTQNRLHLLMPQVLSRVSEYLSGANYAFVAKEFSDQKLYTEDELETIQEDFRRKLDKEHSDIEEANKQERSLSGSVSDALRGAILVNEGELDPAEEFVLILAELLHTHQALTASLAERSRRLVDRAFVQGVSNEVEELVAGELSPGLDEYNVVLGNVQSIGGGRGFVGDVVAAESFDGRMVVFTSSMATKFFPYRGSVYIPNSMLSTEPTGVSILPIIAEKGSHGGQNEYRAAGFWDGVVEVIHCRTSLLEYELLATELKSMTFDGGRHALWFSLRDGAFISPPSRRDRFTVQAFAEKWKYIAPSELPMILPTTKYAPSNQFESYELVSMLSDSDVLALLSELDRTNSKLPSHLSIRLQYLKNNDNASLNTAAFLQEFIGFMSTSESLSPMYSAALNSHIQRNAPEIEAIRREHNELTGELYDLREKIKGETEKANNLQANLVAKLQRSVQDAQSDLASLFKDPYLAALLPSVAPIQSHEHLGTTPIATREAEDLVEIKLDTSDYLRRLKATSWSDEALYTLKRDILHYVSKGYVFEVRGESALSLIELILTAMSESRYEIGVSLFADNVERLVKDVSLGRNGNLVIHGVNQQQIEFYRSAVSFRFQCAASKNSPVFFVVDGKSLFKESGHCICLDSAKVGHVSGTDFEEGDIDSLESLPKSLRFDLGSREGILRDLVYMSYSENS